MSNLRLKGLLYAVCCFMLIAPTQAQTYRDSLLASRQAKLEHVAKDPTAPLKRTDIQYVHHYEPDSGYRVQATIELLLNEQPFRMPTSDGTSKEYIRYAKARFSIDGRASELTIYRSTDLFVSPAYRNHLFLPFTDETNGGETYGAGRYIDLSMTDIRDGRIAIDFNNAYNPYCAYSGGYRCPVPPAENHLPIAIKAGEKNYTGPIKDRPKPKVPPKPLTDMEQDLVRSGDTAQRLRVIQDSVPDELRVLKKTSEDVDPKDEWLPLLAKRMYLAVTDSLHPGVGIAAPQIGINRNVIWVQRFDKAGEPLELYLNPKITWRSKLLRKGLEGCLSIADTMGQVLRNYAVHLSYQDAQGSPREELVEGFTAVIFQHEIDHLLGILFTDRLAEQESGTYHRINDEVEWYLKERVKRP